jgi:hypothetical protein
MRAPERLTEPSSALSLHYGLRQKRRCEAADGLCSVFPAERACAPAKRGDEARVEQRVRDASALERRRER